MEAPPLTPTAVCPKCGFTRQSTIIPGVFYKDCQFCAIGAVKPEPPITNDREVNCKVAHQSMCEAIHRGNEWRKLRKLTVNPQTIGAIDEHIRMAEEAVQKALQQLRDALETK